MGNKTGQCCPNDKGVYDPCCSNFRAAVNNKACKDAKLTGNTCPDEHGKYHKCCHMDAKCSYQNQCPGLGGDCCPTPGGVMLGCCKNKAVETDLVATEVFEETLGVALTLAVLMKLRQDNSERSAYVT